MQMQDQTQNDDDNHVTKAERHVVMTNRSAFINQNCFIYVFRRQQILYFTTTRG